MADAPAAQPPARSRSGFNLSNPGMKEYLIIGGVALVGGLIYFKLHPSATAASTTPATTTPTVTPLVTGPAGGGGMNWRSFLQNQQTSPTPSTPASTAAGPPTAATGLSAAGNQLSWQPVPGASAYNVQVWNYQTGQEAFIQQTSTPSVSVPGLSSGTTYDFYVQPVNSSGVGPIVNGSPFTP